MQVPFAGKWRGTVTGANAGQRVVVSSATSGNDAYNGVREQFRLRGWTTELQWRVNWTTYDQFLTYRTSIGPRCAVPRSTCLTR